MSKKKTTHKGEHDEESGSVPSTSSQKEDELKMQLHTQMQDAQLQQQHMKDMMDRMRLMELQAQQDREIIQNTTRELEVMKTTTSHQSHLQSPVKRDSDPSDDENSDDEEQDAGDGPKIRSGASVSRSVASGVSRATESSEALYRSTRLPKMPVKGTKYSGVEKDENVQTWVDEFQTLKVSGGWTDEQTIALAGLHLTQVARNWFNHVGHKYPTWNTFSRAIVKQYGRMYSPHLIRELVSQMPGQREDESCAEFLGRVRTRLNEYGVYKDREIADAFLERMRPEWKQQVLGNIGDTRVNSMDILAIASKWEIAVKAARFARGAGPKLPGVNPRTEHNAGDNIQLKKKRFDGTCHYCGKPGHREVDCRKKKYDQEQGSKQKTEKKDGDKPAVICSHCKKPGHVEQNCWTKYPDQKPKKPRDVRMITIEQTQQQISTSEAIIISVEREQPQIQPENIKGERGKYAVMGRISNVHVPMTLDIGAEDTSCLAESVFRLLPQSVRDTLQPSEEKLRMADHAALSHLGVVQVPIRLNPESGNDSREMNATMHVVPDLNVSCLLGSDFTERYVNKIDFQERKMELITGDKIQVHVKEPVSKSRQHVIMLSKDITLSPFTAIITSEAHAMMPSGVNKQGSVWLTEPNEAVLGDGVLVARTAQDLPTKAKKGNARVILQMTNATAHPITYKTGRRIATLQQIDVMVSAEYEEKQKSIDVKTDNDKLIEEQMSHKDQDSATQGTAFHSQITALLQEYAHLFDNREPGAARMSGEVVEHSIDTGNAHPIAQRPRRQAPAMEAVIEKEVNNLLDSKIIRPSNSPWQVIWYWSRSKMVHGGHVWTFVI
jgi:hypothetical protein